MQRHKQLELTMKTREMFNTGVIQNITKKIPGARTVIVSTEDVKLFTQ
jgi:hypothetical protein